ncbi:hypothetical protein ACSZN8_19155 [Aeromonas caviae]
MKKVNKNNASQAELTGITARAGAFLWSLISSSHRVKIDLAREESKGGAV